MLASCSLRPSGAPSREIIIPSSQKVNLADSGAVRKIIYQQYQRWKGTKYSIGGLSRQGIDCSGLVYATYREGLGITLPRSTELQVQAGRRIKRSELRSGDLVFFKTGFKVRHVGIYIENGKFFHASTKRGVMISNLNNYYWKDKYWHARRMEA
jgi:cell wall-associated NlpC family hydrolase